MMSRSREYEEARREPPEARSTEQTKTSSRENAKAKRVEISGKAAKSVKSKKAKREQ